MSYYFILFTFVVILTLSLVYIIPGAIKYLCLNYAITFCLHVSDFSQFSY